MLKKHHVKHKEGLRFYVAGREYAVYEVDLAENAPHGWCSCEDYEFRKRELHSKTDQPVRCKHIAFVRELLIDGIVEEYNKQEKARKKDLPETPDPNAGVPDHRPEVPERTSRVREVRQEKVYRPASYRAEKRRSKEGTGPEESYRLMQALPQLGDDPP